MAYKLLSMEKDRIPPAVLNFVVKERFCPIPIDLQKIAVRVETSTGGYGSGVAVGRRLVVTNSHVVAGYAEGDTVWVDAYGKDGFERVMGTVEKIDRARDMAAIRLPLNFNFKVKAQFATSDPEWGGVVIMVGCPSGMLPLATRGHFGYRVGNKSAITCEGFWGNSGGPVFNPAGQVIGIAHKMGVATRPGETQVWATHLHVLIPYDWVTSYLQEYRDTIDK